MPTKQAGHAPERAVAGSRAMAVHMVIEAVFFNTAKKRRKNAKIRKNFCTCVNWQSAGSHKDECDIWRGGVSLGSYSDAAAREFGVINDARGRGRYTGRIYQGKGGRAMVVVVVVYAPDAHYDVLNQERGDYSQRL